MAADERVYSIADQVALLRAREGQQNARATDITSVYDAPPRGEARARDGRQPRPRITRECARGAQTLVACRASSAELGVAGVLDGVDVADTAACAALAERVGAGTGLSTSASTTPDTYGPEEKVRRRARAAGLARATHSPARVLSLSLSLALSARTVDGAALSSR